jgi:hypothetical protein
MAAKAGTAPNIAVTVRMEASRAWPHPTADVRIIDILKARMPDLPLKYIPMGMILNAMDKQSQANYLPDGLK